MLSYNRYATKHRINPYYQSTFIILIVPGSVELLTAKAVPGLGIDVSWNPPVEPRGTITKYIMSYKTAKVKSAGIEQRGG